MRRWGELDGDEQAEAINQAVMVLAVEGVATLEDALDLAQRAIYPDDEPVLWLETCLIPVQVSPVRCRCGPRHQPWCEWG